MLTGLAIQNIVLIEALALDLAPGLVVLTGETGAGKSILLDALGLVLGNRADAGLVRAGCEAARVVAEFEVAADHPVRALLAEHELDGDGPIILRRQLKADGGSRAFVNDQPVSAALLRELGGALVEIHGQHDERGLLSPKGHRALLDQFGGLGGAVADCRTAWTAWKAAEAEAQAARARLAEDQRDREWLDHAVAELQALAAQVGEEGELALARAAMQKGARIADDLAAVAGQLTTGSATLAQAARRLDRISGEHDLLAEALAALDRALVEAGEAETRLIEATQALDADPARLEQVEARLFELRAMARKHKVEADALPALAETLQARAAALVAGEGGLVALDAAVAAAEAAYGRAAAQLSAARTAAAARLDSAVAGELAPLKLDTARFRTALAALPVSDWGPEGQERVEFEIATNPGADFAPLMKIASGGELSRFILALKVALASTGSAGTMIFDEIDRGVGGAVASAIGERLARLAGQAQVLVVTHSPQVAARGHSHWRIEKASDGSMARTNLALLDAAARQEEIARMLSGADVTPEARAQARRLLEGD
ncbi:DNA repair protein RecN [Sandarakinorhabdus cyanobacteriorum]|uniref:DNA repair protein RecN n=1 Tax=Sandarakinorhabdus cyanobacteriorum TaxID=1981098 RepID=A0A255YHM5_9SPHN|nr:DNA repair protein RecN [Sandarakinorhabdus cyanobacteriorum]OYQ28746.1 DNA repair protein RecN [Sandarakinorhabdus cyanobacteriorum]